MNDTNGPTQLPPRTVATNIDEVTHDIISLAELQMQLCKIDTQEAVGQLTAPAALLVVAAAVALGTIPVALLFIAEVLVAVAGLSYGLALLTAMILGFGTAAIIAVVGRRKLRKPFRLFVRSRDELRRNLRWMKRVLARQETSPDSSRGASPCS